jgi:hypothetical protein
MLTLRPLPLLWRVTIGAIVLHVAAIVVERTLGISRLTGPLRQVDLNAEANLTAWFGSFLLLSCAAVSGAIAVAERDRDRALGHRWTVLALLLLLMSVDESAQLHDMATGPLRRTLGTELGLFHFAWVIPALVALVAVALHLHPLVRSLEARERTRLLVGAAVYLGGAVVMEMVGGLVVDVDVEVNGYTLPYLATVTVEEGCELVGALLILGALLEIGGRRRPHLVLGIAPDPVGARVEIESGAAR